MVHVLSVYPSEQASTLYTDAGYYSLMV